ncbi:DUF3105 domain-containing protein [Modestobacter sp. Leaf380]|uniref:DUF3105 domain-containing protein n=1 Tax=Modestobacter sp. Leaf380 TaxID=1736356 RepID=UPI0006F2F5F6|nr:DUF3105 domain-containing protein [Modestobacter sp. Leaf380]KQS73309.1 hypothetical protein ASG41_01055 [Modestobacter sp. Leaf380]
MPEDPKPENKTGASAPRTPGKGAGGRAATPAGKGLGGSGKGASARPGAGKGRTRPQQAVVAKPKPWGLIAAAIAVVVFAGAVIGYAVYAVDRSNADRVTAADQIEGVQTFDYAAGQQHVTTPVTYEQSPPVGGPHDGEWADCTGTVYDVDIRHENAVHGLEHGAVWITYDADAISDDDLATLTDLVEGNSGMMLSPYAGLGSTISLQSWNHQLAVDSATDPRVEQFVDFFVFGQDEDGEALYPEPGASCENPLFAEQPLVVGDSSRSASGDVPTDSETTTAP